MNSLEMVLQGVNAACGFVRLVNSTTNLADRDISLELRTYNLVGRVLGFGFSVYEAGALVHQTSSEELMFIKELELAEKILVELPSRIGLTLARIPKWTFPQDCQEELLPAFTEIFRVGSEVFIYDEGHFLEMTPEERANHTRPNTVKEGCGFNITTKYLGEKPISTQECEKNREGFEKGDLALTLIKAVLESKVASKIGAPFFAPQIPLENPTRQQEIAPPLDESDASDLLTLSYIPKNLYEDDPDSIFLRYVCPITHMPIRHPVKDPTVIGNHCACYEKKAIYDWLRRNPRSVLTNLPLTISQLLPMPAAQNLIDAKLRACQEKWNLILTTHPELRGLPTNQQPLVDAARTEMGPANFG